MPPAFVGSCLLAIVNWVLNTKDIKIRHIHQDLELVVISLPRGVLDDWFFDPSRCGRSAIKRAAVVEGSGYAFSVSRKVPISEANLRVAASPGNLVNFAASCQGSTSNRAKPERTLTSIPFLSSPIGANRKSLNSAPGRVIAAARLISVTDQVSKNS